MGIRNKGAGIVKAKYRRRNTFCVWDNHDDSLVALDQPSDVCAALMKVPEKTFYIYVCDPKRGTRWTIIRSKDIESEDEDE